MKRKIAVVVALVFVVFVLLLRARRSEEATQSRGVSATSSSSERSVRTGQTSSKRDLRKVGGALRKGKNPSDPSGGSDTEPTTVWDVDKRHPGFGNAYQAATVPPSFQLMYKCQRIIAQKDPNDFRPREYKFVDIYNDDGHGSMVLTDSDVIPETDDDPEFFECLKEGRLAANIHFPITQSMAVKGPIVIYESGRLLNYKPTPEKVDAVLKSLAEQLSDMEADNPYRSGAEMQQTLFRCYQERGTDVDSRVECLTLASKRQ